MATDLVPIDPQLIALVTGAFGKDGSLLPFVREILLIECHVAGTSHQELTEVEPQLAVGDALILEREPENPHDARAIRIRHMNGAMLGYVPRAKNEALANLMDAGKLLFGRLEQKAKLNDWLKLDIRILLRDS